MYTSRRSKGSLSPHCMAEGPHGVHWVPASMEGSLWVEDLCVGTPRAVVTGPDGYERAVEVYLDRRITGEMVQVAYVDTHTRQPTGIYDFVSLSSITVHQY